MPTISTAIFIGVVGEQVLETDFRGVIVCFGSVAGERLGDAYGNLASITTWWEARTTPPFPITWIEWDGESLFSFVSADNRLS